MAHDSAVGRRGHGGVKLMLNGWVEVQLTPDGRIGLGLDGLQVTVAEAEAVRNGSRTSAGQAEERGFDSRPPLQPSIFTTAGLRGNHERHHLRTGRTSPGCRLCVESARPDVGGELAPIAQAIAPEPEATDSRSDRPDRPDVAPTHRSNDDDRSSIVVDSPSDLPLSHAVLLRKYSRGGQRRGHVSSRAIRRIRAVLACPDAGHDDHWCAAILDDARGDAVRCLEEAHTQLHAPGPPDPEVVAEAAEAERRRQAYVLRQQLEAGVDELGRPLGELARQVAERQLLRLDSAGREPPMLDGSSTPAHA